MKKQDLFKYLKGIFVAVAAYLATLSAWQIKNVIGVSHDYYGVTSGMTPWAVLLFALIIILLKRMFEREERRLHVFSLVLGFFAALSVDVGTYCIYVNDIFIDGKTVGAQILTMLGLMIITVPVCEELFVLIDTMSARLAGNDELPSDKKNKRRLFVYWLIIFIAYLPFFLAFWPGNFIYDARYQMTNVIDGIYTTHHPLAHTLLMGAFYKLGVNMGNASAGFQFYTLIQMLVLSFSFAFTSANIAKRGASRLVRGIVVAWFALCPINGLFAITATKDVLFAAFLLILINLLWDYITSDEYKKWYQYIPIAVFAMLSMLFRNNAKYAIFVGTIVIIAMIKERKRKLILAIAIIAGIFSYMASDFVLVKATDAKETTTYREMSSVPLQLMARLNTYHPGRLMEEEADEIYRYVSPEFLMQYNPYNSDIVKNNANEELLKTNYPNFIKLWLKLTIKHPDEAIESIATNTVGFWYLIDKPDWPLMNISAYHTIIGKGEEIEKKNLLGPVGGVYEKLFVGSAMKDSPVFGWFYRSDFSIWALGIMLFYGLARKRKELVMIIIIPLMYFATCLLGPISAIRYVYCLIVLLPLWFAILIEKRNND